MKQKIDGNSGLVWKYLNNKRGATIREIRKDCKLTERDTYAALGWLAREGKLAFNEVKNECEVVLL